MDCGRAGEEGGGAYAGEGVDGEVRFDGDEDT